MTSFRPMPPEAAMAIGNMLDDCARIQRDQHVLILAATDGLYGGRNIVDEQAIAWIQAGVQARGAHPSVLWVDMPIRKNVLWPDIPTPDTVWRIPKVVKEAVKTADVLINHVLDLSSEEELKEWPQFLKDNKVPMVRNMATTAPLLCSAWARTPHRLINEIRFRTGEMVKAGERWKLTHPNGTHLEGTVGAPGRGGEGYSYWRDTGYYWPFPEGIYPAVNPVGAQGTFVFDQMMPVWARHIGVPVKFRAPVRVTVENNQMVKFEGGAEAETIRAFLSELAKVVGKDHAFEIRGPHGGIHPAAKVTAAQCPDEDYREFIESFHAASVHMHLGQGGKAKAFPYNLHTAAEVRGATLTVGNATLHDNGRLGVMDDPRVQAVAAEYRDRPGFDGEQWLYG
ncbi:MAG: hypothetical protein ACM30I_04280 [Gemmatimonas sp.]